MSRYTKYSLKKFVCEDLTTRSRNLLKWTTRLKMTLLSMHIAAFGTWTTMEIKWISLGNILSWWYHVCPRRRLDLEAQAMFHKDLHDGDWNIIEGRAKESQKGAIIISSINVAIRFWFKKIMLERTESCDVAWSTQPAIPTSFQCNVFD